MTKTTNYEISKKLAEIGFKAEAEKCWAKIRHSVSSEFNLVNLDFAVPQNCDEWVLSYDLETLLNALPSSIKYKNEYNVILYYEFFLQNDKLGYYYEYGEYGNDYHMGDGIFEFSKLSLDESLADIAGRMLILLHEEKLIKF
jgi:hypothetical protein